MFLRLLLLFTIVPLLELWILLRISDATNTFFTVMLVLVTGLVGAGLARRQGWQVWQRIGRQLAQGETPAGGLLDGLLILIAGALLITPGVLTDIVGFALLTPKLRELMKIRLKHWFLSRATVHFQSTTSAQTSSHWSPPHHAHADETIIDAEFTTHTSQPSGDGAIEKD